MPLIHDDMLADRPNVPTWTDWSEAAGADDAEVSRGLRFNSPDHALQAAGEGAGVLLAQHVLAYDNLRSGGLVIPALADFDGDHGLLVAHQAAEEIPQNFQQAVFLGEQLLTMGSLIIFTDAGAPLDPGDADITAHGARCNADPGIVANALHLAGISFGINIENGDGGRVAQYIPSEPDGSGHTDPRLAEGFQVKVLRPGELHDAIRHYGSPIR